MVAPDYAFDEQLAVLLEAWRADVDREQIPDLVPLEQALAIVKAAGRRPQPPPAPL